MGNSNSSFSEITETVRAIGRARTAQELDNQNMQNLAERMCHATVAFNRDEIPEPAASVLIAAFLSGDPSKAYRNLVELRSGKSLGDLS